MPADGNWILCSKDSMSTDDIDIDVDGVAISTTTPDDHGIKADHAGGTATTPADIIIDVTGTSTKNTISTTGSGAEGVYGKHTGTGDVDIDVTGVGISTTSSGASAVYGEHTGNGNIDITIEGNTTGNTLSTAGAQSQGVYGKHTGTGNVDIDMEDITITATGGTAVNAGAANGVRVEHTGDGNVDIDAKGVGISTMGSTLSSSEGVLATHTGIGDIGITIEGKTTGTTTTPSTITTTTDNSRGIYIQQTPLTGKTGGNIAITLGDTQINTGGAGAHGVHSQIKSRSSGTLTATLNSGVTITTQGSSASGVYLTHGGGDAAAVDNDVTLTAQGITVRTTGDSSYGLQANREAGRGDATINTDRSTITTEGDSAIAIYGVRTGDGNGALTIDATNGSITTGSATEKDGTITRKGYTAFGIYGLHQSTASPPGTAAGDIRITTRNFDITTTSTADHPSALTGPYAYGIYAVHENSGNIVIDMQQGSSVTTKGENSHGIVTYHYGEAATRSMDITISGPVKTEGAYAQGVRVGTISGGAPARMAALDADGYRRQTVTVNNRISSQGPGIYLVNGGRVIIGREGSIRADSGVAILATGTVPEDSTDPMNVIPAIKPKLRVDMNLGGRRVSSAIGDDWIINDGGETTIAVNGVVLHEGATGVVEGAVARNGAWDVRMLAEGVKVTDRTTDPDPAN